MINARLDEDGTRIGFDDGDRIALVHRDHCCGDRPVIVSDPKPVEGGRVEWDREEIRLPDGEEFGWAFVGDGPEPFVMAEVYRDQWVTAPRMTWCVIADEVER